ncbi:BP28CT domain protein [Ancylostoma ceylanicum]|uniref:HEAT repeat-containing protein 1 n=1 Tax=Ancylostoma ceylanicum TaxID=53326 RepID=A0A0D6M8I5_9BILA|nr:BP28CT domain protein [Ancylostoma ceylanicum]
MTTCEVNAAHFLALSVNPKLAEENVELGYGDRSDDMDVVDAKNRSEMTAKMKLDVLLDLISTYIIQSLKFSIPLSWQYMTSLSSQLQSLRTATAQHQTVERKHVSLLFEKAEAQTLDREAAFQIGCAGLQKLKQLDAVFEAPNDLFDESRLHFQRSMISKEENAVLNEKLEKLLFHLSPYLQHFACQQVLEWLVFKYQIYSYNAEAMILTFLPFHETNFFGRMLSIIEYNFTTSKDWGFLEDFCKKRYPVPFTAILKSTMSSTHSLITKISEHINKGVQLVGEEFLEAKCHMLFTFYAKLLVYVLEESTKINDVLLSKVIPLAAVGLKATLKTLRNESELGLWHLSKDFAKKTDLTGFLKALWTSLFSIMAEESYAADHKECLRALRETSDPEILSGTQATFFLSKLLEYAYCDALYNNKKFSKRVSGIVARFSDQWMELHSEWTSRDETVLASVIQHYQLEKFTVVVAQPEMKKKRMRRRSNSIRKSISETVSVNKLSIEESAAARAEEMAASSDFARRQSFSGDPIRKAREWIKKEDWENVIWAFDEINTRKSYFVNKATEDVEDFVLEIVKLAVRSSKNPVLGAARLAFAEAFHSETADDYGKRLTFVIDMLVNTTAMTVDARIFSILFGLIKEFGEGNDAMTVRVVSLLLKVLKSPGKYKISSADLKMDFVVEMMRTTHSHHILRDSLRLLTAAVRVLPASVTSHVMSVFTFMGNGLLRKDNELTLRIIEDTLEALFRAVCEEDGKTLPTEMRLRLIGVARVFAASVFDIPAHRRARMAHAIARAVKHISVWIVLSAAIDLVEFIVRLGSDHPSESAPQILDQTIFDRSKYSIPKLRHFRFVTIGLVVKILSNRKLYERLGAVDDALLYQSMLPIGKRLMTASVELGEFVDKENAAADQGNEPQTVRYWVALSSRAETVSEKLRHLMPGGVAAKIITDILEDEETDWRMREKALQLANLKLIHDGFFFSESGINEEHLERMAVVLNKWLVKERLDREKIILCQNAAFTLKLVAKRLSCRSDSSTLADTIGKCTNMVADYQTLDECMVGNALLLAGELIRSHNMRTTMMSAIPLLKTCLSILNECSLNQQSLQDPSNQTEDANGKRRRICALTCTQRILDQFAPFVSQFIPEILVQFCRLCGRYCDSDAKPNVNSAERSHPLQTLSSIQHRLALIRAALLKLEIRVIGEHFAKAVIQISGEENVERIANVERSIFSSLLAMAEVLTENTLRSVVNTLVDWAEQGLKPAATREERGRLITVFMFANSFYDSFNSLALPYFGKLIEMSVKVLNSCNATILVDPSLLLLHGKKDSMDGKEADCLLTERDSELHSNPRQIRYRALLVVEAIFDKVGDGVAPHLPMVMPFLSELLEDENRNVEEQCDRVVRLLQMTISSSIDRRRQLVCATSSSNHYVAKSVANSQLIALAWQSRFE